MGIRDTLLNEVKSALGPAIRPSLSTASARSDLFEAYALMLVVQAARIEGATASYRDPSDRPTTDFAFRTSPGYLWSTIKPYTFVLIQFDGKEALEAHMGVRVAGASGVPHELDVCVIRRSEAVTSRARQVHPRSRKVVIAVECKFYTTNLSLALARAFIGLATDVRATDSFFVSNASSEPVEKLLTARKRKWGNRVYPGETIDVDRLRNEFQIAFRNFKAV
jgi:hypothetical protein